MMHAIVVCATDAALFDPYLIKINKNYISSASADMLYIVFMYLLGIASAAMFSYCMSLLLLPAKLHMQLSLSLPDLHSHTTCASLREIFCVILYIT